MGTSSVSFTRGSAPSGPGGR
uniref:Uncharacterized protein n=1 Tax=Anguilla anguilla TaxID=7936 RepID=A0A0E9XRA4_ANGAN